MVDVAAVARAAGVELAGRLAHGEGTGAYAVRRADGTDAVMKLFTGDVLDLGASTAFVDALHARGYPVPRVYDTGVIDGVAYEIQERMPGEPLEQVTVHHLAALRTLVERQRDVGIRGRGPWVEQMVASVVDGGVGYCEHTAMLAHSNETRALLERLRRIADAARNVDVANDDVVHYDFSPYNILAVGDRITGVVDWAGATNGDASFDLVTLAYYTTDYAVRDALLEMAGESAPPAALGLYAAHMVLRQVDWSLRNHGELEVEWFVGLGGDLLARLGARSRGG